jgi:hypothetical protein
VAPIFTGWKILGRCYAYLDIWVLTWRGSRSRQTFRARSRNGLSPDGTRSPGNANGDIYWRPPAALGRMSLRGA